MARSSGVITKHVMESWWPRKTRMSVGAGAWIWADKEQVTIVGTMMTLPVLPTHPSQKENRTQGLENKTFHYLAISAQVSTTVFHKKTPTA